MASSASSSRRRLADQQHIAWQGKTDGTPWMQRTLVSLFRWMPLGVLYGVMALVVPFYMLLDRKGYKASYAFARKRLGKGPVSAFLYVYRNEYRMGQVVLDRFAAFAGKRFELERTGVESFYELAGAGRGFLMLSSHTGCFELVGLQLPSPVRINALVFPGETETVMRHRDLLFRQTNVSMIAANEDLSHLFRINNALADGQIVSMPGDRVFGARRTVRSLFFGQPAAFPSGPFSLALQREVPVLAVMVMKEGRRRYHVYAEQLSPVGETRAERLQSLSDAYARMLERIIRRYPDQWFNFYDFWA